MFTLIRSFALLLLFWLPALQAADSGWLQNPQNSHAQVRLRADHSQADRTLILLDIQLQDGWKTYWRSPGEGGIAPEIRWQNSAINARWFWPLPQRFDVAGISTQGYHQRVTLPITLSGPVPDNLAGVLTLSTCSNVCILTDYPFSLDLAASADVSFAHDYAQAMGRVPIESGLTDSVTAGYQQGELQIIAGRPDGWQHPALFIDTLEGASFGEPRFILNGSQLVAHIPVSDEWGDSAPDITGKNLSLVLADGGLAQQITLPISAGVPFNSPAVPFWQMLLIALAGGFILNLMPCVLPVLGMKLGTIIHAERRDRRSVRLQFLASSAGIIASFLALALLMTALRLGNHALGWGIQFQNPWFIGVMVAVTLLFSASLFGLLHLRLPSAFNTRLATHSGRGLGGHFCQGAFATLLATPCSAPFLGTAVAFALAAPLPLLWVMFVALGIGMSLPWLLIAAWPVLALKMPRPGRWMNGLQTLLGMLMLGSCFWLLSLLVNHIGFTATLLVAAIIALLLLAALIKQWGIRRTGSVVAVLLLTAGGLWQAGFYGGNTPAKYALQDRLNWQPLSEQAIRQALDARKRVFIDVTADWCVTCKANKYNVLLRDDVQQALLADDVVTLRGDWSRPSDEIARFLQQRGSAAVPFNQIYGPGVPHGVVLSPLLDRADLLKILDDAKGTEQ
ncbi:protein-disulfide reductase DsbD family protein [Erwinia sorbitola]|uniref:Protein-disulfide reductase n=1 Tax=Erwinia sorbitola TaxID=2681984 RepID=A0ABW9RA32_9GAMM|nr:protein-disulfide reductase DsbD domain-containing protein [Erwinia sorbitola]MTD26919.1 protein-disulfide reductase [Erwinia sorbitola]